MIYPLFHSGIGQGRGGLFRRAAVRARTAGAHEAGISYGVTRLFIWAAWAHIANSFAWDLSGGGPDWIIPVHL